MINSCVLIPFLPCNAIDLMSKCTYWGARATPKVYKLTPIAEKVAQTCYNCYAMLFMLLSNTQSWAAFSRMCSMGKCESLILNFTFLRAPEDGPTTHIPSPRMSYKSFRASSHSRWPGSRIADRVYLCDEREIPNDIDKIRR